MTASFETAWIPPGPLTVADLEGMPEDGHRYELLDGVLVVSPGARWSHQFAAGELFVTLKQACPAHLDVLFAPFSVRPGADPSSPVLQTELQTELQPDLLVAEHGQFRDTELPSAPLLAVEVLSPSTRLVDLHLKKAACERMGTPHYWVVDADVPSLTVFTLVDGVFRRAAHVERREVYSADEPFPVRVRPADLVTRESGPRP
ncbi:MAG: Uma2 family endonuclease [Kineosporiaceae bacterium]